MKLMMFGSKDQEMINLSSHFLSNIFASKYLFVCSIWHRNPYTNICLLDSYFIRKHGCNNFLSTRIASGVKKNNKSDVQSSGQIPEVDMDNQARYSAFVLAVWHKIVSTRNVFAVTAVLMPKVKMRSVKDEWNVKPIVFEDYLYCKEQIFFCVPLNDRHLPITDYSIR